MRTALFIAIPLLLVMAWTWPLCISIFKRRRASMVYPHASIQQLLDLGANPPRAGVTMKQAAARYSTTTDGVFVHTRIELTPEGRRAASVTSGVLALLLSLTACAAKPAPAPLPTFPPVIQEEPFTPPRLKQRQYEVSDLAFCARAQNVPAVSGTPRGTSYGFTAVAETPTLVSDAGLGTSTTVGVSRAVALQRAAHLEHFPSDSIVGPQWSLFAANATGELLDVVSISGRRRHFQANNAGQWCYYAKNSGDHPSLTPRDHAVHFKTHRPRFYAENAGDIAFLAQKCGCTGQDLKSRRFAGSLCKSTAETFKARAPFTNPFNAPAIWWPRRVYA